MKPNNLWTWAAIPLLVLLSCKEKEKVTPDCSPIQVQALSQPAGCGASDGALNLTVSGGEAPYEYSLNGADFQSSPEFGALPAGEYTVTVRDKNMCTGTSEAVVEESSGIEASFNSSAAGCGGADGGITVASTGGTGAHVYSIDGVTFQNSGAFSGLSAKKYNVTVRDESGCSTTSEVQVQSGISFGRVIKPIIDANCAVSGCHVQGAQSPNFTVFNNIKSSAASIKAKTADKSMPKVGSLTDAEILQIACWVDDGALDN